MKYLEGLTEQELDLLDSMVEKRPETTELAGKLLYSAYQEMDPEELRQTSTKELATILTEVLQNRGFLRAKADPKKVIDVASEAIENFHKAIEDGIDLFVIDMMYEIVDVLYITKLLISSIHENEKAMNMLLRVIDFMSEDPTDEMLDRFIDNMKVD